jgi:hypothetical protein
MVFGAGVWCGRENDEKVPRIVPVPTGSCSRAIAIAMQGRSVCLNAMRMIEGGPLYALCVCSKEAPLW